jgi:hypothetical protein
MPRYKCISEFRHTIVIQGKKYLVGPDDVIESPSPISYIFLNEVDPSTPVTVKNAFAGGRLQQQVSNLQQEKDHVVNVSSAGIEQLKQQIETLSAKFDKEMDDLTKQINERFEENEKADLANKQADTKFKEDTNRRLGILKDAVRSMEGEIFGDAETPSPKA